MQVRNVIAAALLAVTAVGAMAQEIDRSENLQGKSLAAQAQAADAGRTRADVKAELAQWRQTHKLVVGELG